jgi:hypothetical protein
LRRTRGADPSSAETCDERLIARPLIHPLDRSHKSTLAAVGLKPKDLIGIPWSVAFALRADGWWRRRDFIWCLSVKPLRRAHDGIRRLFGACPAFLGQRRALSFGRRARYTMRGLIQTSRGRVPRFGLVFRFSGRFCEARIRVG